MGRLLRVGLTGGIGSGKSTVARLLAMMEAAVYVADDRAKGLMVSDPLLRRQIIDLLGEQAYTTQEGGSLDRAYIASQVFGDHAKLAALNALVHPAVERDFMGWVSELEHATAKPAYAVEEAAVLIESGAWQRMDCVVNVTAPMDVRITRVMRRDGISEAAAKARIDAQLSDAERAKYADYTLEADEKRLLIPQVTQLHAALCRAAERI